MDRRIRAIKLLIAALTFLVFNPDTSQAARPNVIIVMTDDQGYGELSVHGNPILQTPELDRLHGESIRLTDFHVAPMCTPTRGQLLTGMDAVKNGAINVSSGRTLLSHDMKTIANYFQGAGYATGLFGKWHLGDNYPYRPQDRGFDETLWFPSSHIGSVPDYWGNDYFEDTYMRNGKEIKYEGYCTDVFFEEAMTWMKRQKSNGKPFFTYLPTNAPHQPFYALEEDIREMEKVVNEADLDMTEDRKYNFIRYLAMIRNIDKNMGQLRDFLTDENLEENTILIFLTDNGSTFGPEYYNAGMRGKKTTLWEGGHRVPFFIKWPSGLKEARDIEGLTQVQDILPTLLDFCEIENSNDFDGVSLAKVFRNEEEVNPNRVIKINYSRMPVFFNYPSPYANSIIQKKGTGILYKRWRLINGSELYNLESDPMQKNNVYNEHPEIARFLELERDAWWSSVEDVVNTPHRVIIGKERNRTQKLTACEWMDVFVDQQIQVVRGDQKNSYQLLKVAEPGTYTFELRRWPKEIDAPIAGGSEYGKTFPVKGSKIFIETEGATLNGRKPIQTGDKEVTYKFDLEPGPIAMHTWFVDENGQGIAGSYYVYVTRVK